MKQNDIYNHTEEKGRKLTIYGAKRKMEEYLFFLKFFSQLFYIHFYVVQKIKMPLMALSYDNHTYFTKSEKHQSYHYMLSLTFTTLGQQSGLQQLRS